MNVSCEAHKKLCSTNVHSLFQDIQIESESRPISLSVMTSSSLLFVIFIAAVHADDPVFLSYRVLEERPAGTLVGNLASHHKLREHYARSSMDVLAFKAVNDTRTMFTLSERGVLRTAVIIDRDRVCADVSPCRQSVVVIVEPSSIHLLVVTVIVDIVDINDNVPQFTSPHFTLDINEATAVGAKIALPTATDRDGPPNGVKSYRLASPDGTFVCVSGAVPRLALRRRLDRETHGHYSVTLWAVDGGEPALTGSVLIQVTVRDANDNAPRFQNSTYNMTVKENIPVRTLLLTTNATDSDIGANGRLTYTLVGRSRHLFSVDATTGELWSARPLDYETARVHTLHVVAVDHGPVPLSATTTVTIQLQDVNDNRPQIQVSDDPASVDEGKPAETLVTYVGVHDADSGANGVVTCQVHSQDFQLKRVSSNGFIVVTLRTFRRDRADVARHNVTVDCHDGGAERRAASVTFPVHVADVNERPTFTQTAYTATIRENSPCGEPLLRVSATDYDYGANADVTYALRSSQPFGADVALFTLDGASGAVRCRASLDHERTPRVVLVVEAVDRGEPALTATASVIVTVENEDDEAAIFGAVAYHFAVPENAAAGSVVGRVTAADADRPPFDRFRFVLTPASDVLRIDANSGVLTTLAPLDREVEDVHRLVVVATGDARDSAVNVTIVVTDRNDNAPLVTFPSRDNDTLHVSVAPECGAAVGRIEATDPDAGDNARLRYAVHGGGAPFTVDPDTGIVYFVEGRPRGRYQLRLTVSDSGQPALSVSAVLNIVVSPSVRYGPAVATGNREIVVLIGSVTALLTVGLLVAIVAVVCRQGAHKAGTLLSAERDVTTARYDGCDNVCVLEKVENTERSVQQGKVSERSHKS